jgi:hypothetical protein
MKRYYLLVLPHQYGCMIAAVYNKFVCILVHSTVQLAVAYSARACSAVIDQQ